MPKLKFRTDKRLLCIFAHPDDESFGPAGTIAKYASKGVEVHLLTATKGEKGEQNLRLDEVRGPLDSGIEKTREKELLEAAKVLGIKKVEFLGARDGEIANNVYHEIANKIIKKIKNFSPQVILTHDRLGISGHLDHIGVSMITTYSFLKTKVAKKLYYHCLSKKETPQFMIAKYFVYFPPGYDKSKITTTIATKAFWRTKVKAMKEHKSQMRDVRRVYLRQLIYPKKEYFILGYWQGIKPNLPESDLFDQIG